MSKKEQGKIPGVEVDIDVEKGARQGWQQLLLDE